jgi:hypothetical protein
MDGGRNTKKINQTNLYRKKNLNGDPRIDEEIM